MKKLYIKPIIEAETIERQEIMAQSPEIVTKNPTEDPVTPPTDPPSPSEDTGDFAKRGNTWFDDTDW